MMEKEITLRTCKLSPGGLSRNCVLRITDCPDMTLTAYRGRKHQITQLNSVTRT